MAKTIHTSDGNKMIDIENGKKADDVNPKMNRLHSLCKNEETLLILQKRSDL